MPSESTAVYVGAAVMVVVILVLAYQSWESHCQNAGHPNTEFMRKKKGGRSAPPAKKKGFSESELEEFLSSRTGSVSQDSYDPSEVGVEQAVVDSHREFVDEAYNSTQGANATDVIRDDTNEVNPRWGLRRVDYTTTFSDSDARTVSSESPDQVEQPNAGKFTL